MGKEKYLIEVDAAPGMTFREGLIYFALNMSIIAIAGVGMAVTAVAENLPWIILAIAVGGSLIAWTVTRCILMLRSGQASQIKTPEIVVISSRDQERLETYQPTLLPQPKKRRWLWK